MRIERDPRKKEAPHRQIPKKRCIEKRTAAATTCITYTYTTAPAAKNSIHLAWKHHRVECSFLGHGSLNRFLAVVSYTH